MTARRGVRVNLTTLTASGGDAQGDTVGGDIENIQGTARASAMSRRVPLAPTFFPVTAVLIRLEGMAGNDTLRGGDGNDLLRGGAGATRSTARVGADTATY